MVHDDEVVTGPEIGGQGLVDDGVPVATVGDDLSGVEGCQLTVRFDHGFEYARTCPGASVWQPDLVDRRRFLTGTAAALAAAGCGSGDGGTGASVQPPTTQNKPPRTTRAAPSVDPAEPPGVDLGDNVFGLGVASGDPDDHSVVIWTRLLPDDIGASVEIPLAWDVADDAGFERIIDSAIVSARVEDALTVRVVVAGLEPDRRYWYRFRIADRVSPTGRTWTLPSVGAGGRSGRAGGELLPVTR